MFTVVGMFEPWSAHEQEIDLAADQVLTVIIIHNSCEKISAK